MVGKILIKWHDSIIETPDHKPIFNQLNINQYVIYTPQCLANKFCNASDQQQWPYIFLNAAAVKVYRKSKFETGVETAEVALHPQLTN